MAFFIRQKMSFWDKAIQTCSNLSNNSTKNEVNVNDYSQRGKNLLN